MSTSYESYEAAQASGLISLRQMQVIEYMLEHQGRHLIGISQGDVGRAFNDASSSFQPRFRELEHSGVITCVGMKQDPVTHRRVKAYQLSGVVPTTKVQARATVKPRDPAFDELLFCARWIRQATNTSDTWCAIRKHDGGKDWIERLKKVVKELSQ